MNTATSTNRAGAVIGTLAWLQGVSLYNNLRRRLLRLRQPKYLFGALAGGAYMYYFVVRQLLRGVQHGGPQVSVAAMHAMAGDLTALAALGLAVFVLLRWLFVSDRARLAFSEAEIAFLFPAPLTRTTLIHFGLLRSQLGIFFSSFLLSLLFRRGSALGENPLQYAISIWLLLSILSLHLLAASFTCERLLDLGMRPWLRRVALVLLVVCVGVACGWAMRGVLHWPASTVFADADALRHWFAGIVGTAPLSWLLAPFRWTVAPLFAADTSGFLRALLPALALLALHYLWVVRSQVAFEDASIAYARRRAEKVAAMREGRLHERQPTKPRSEPFRLAAHGLAPVAFLWKGLIAMGPFYRLRTWLIACAVVIVAGHWLAADPLRSKILLAVAAAISMLGAWILLLGPMILQRGMQRTLGQMDILKATPMTGRQIALGQLLTPALVMSFALALILLVDVVAAISKYGHQPDALALVASGAVGIVLLAPPLCALMLCLPIAAMVYFPAWFASGDGGRGFEIMGQRLLFMGAYLVTLVLSAVPAALIGGLGYLLANWLAGRVVAVLLAAVLACGVLVFELACAVDLLGRRIDRFDVSQELR